MFLLDKFYIRRKSSFLCVLRSFVIVLNEFVLLVIICCVNLGEERGLGLVVNFSAALIICELDDILMTTGRVQAIKDYYNNLEDESEDVEPREDRAYFKLGDRIYSECGFL